MFLQVISFLPFEQVRLSECTTSSPLPNLSKAALLAVAPASVLLELQASVQLLLRGWLVTAGEGKQVPN